MRWKAALFGNARKTVWVLSSPPQQQLACSFFGRRLAAESFALPATLLLAFISFAQAPRASQDALHNAVRIGNVAEVTQLLNTGSNVNGRNSLGSTPLLEAVWSGNLEIAQLLLSHGADVNAQRIEPDGQPGSTPLGYAVLMNRVPLAKLLLNSGAAVDIRDRKGQSVLHVAAARGNAAIAGMLLDAHADIAATDTSGNTPLEAAIMHGQLATLNLLLAHGADARRVNTLDGRQPIHQACKLGFVQLLPALIDAGADPVARDRSGQTPLDIALAYKNASTVAFLLKLGLKLKESQAAADHAMEAATFRGQSEIVRLLLENGFDPNRPTPAGSAYLNDAALKGYSKVAEVLLAHGASLDKLDANGNSPLHDAAIGGNTDLITLLLNHNANIDARDRESSATPLMLAASLGRAEAVAVLLKRGADPRLRDKSGHTALDRARETDSKETIRLLSPQ